MRTNATKKIMVIIAKKARQDVKAGVPQYHRSNTGQAIEAHIERQLGRPVVNARMGNCSYYRKAYSAAWFFAAYNDLLQPPLLVSTRD